MPLTSQVKLHIAAGKIYFDRMEASERELVMRMGQKLGANQVNIAVSGQGHDLAVAYFRGNSNLGKYKVSNLTNDVLDSSGVKPADA